MLSMKKIIYLFLFTIFLSCEQTVDFTAGTENRMSAIIDFGEWNASFFSDDYLVGDCADSEKCDIEKYDDGDTGNERYYIDFHGRDFYNNPNNCLESWDGIQHSLNIIATSNELENSFQITSGNMAYIGSEENPLLTIVYNLKRFNEIDGDINLQYIGHVGALDVVDMNLDDATVSGRFYGTVYRQDDLGFLDSVVIKDCVFNKINIISN